jgi:hypothetical protein
MPGPSPAPPTTAKKWRHDAGTAMTAPVRLIEDGYLVIPEPVLRPGFLRRLVAAVAAWWRG